MSTHKSFNEEHHINQAIKMACERHIGVLDSHFLCQSVGSLNPPKPICVKPEKPVSEVVAILQKEKIGSVLVVDEYEKLLGIFTERDCVRKVLAQNAVLESALIGSYMTSEVVAQPLETTIAFALNLMSHGGFRHLPLVDDGGHPVGIISVKEMVDYIVTSFTNSLLNFETQS